MGVDALARRRGCAVLLTTHYLEEAEALADRVAVLGRGRIIADGSVREIRARVAQRRIRCVSTLAPETISAWPEVRSICRDGDRLEIVTNSAEIVVRQLLWEDKRAQRARSGARRTRRSLHRNHPGGRVMNTIVQALPRVSLPRIYALEGKHEFLRLLRAPSFAVPTLLFPAVHPPSFTPRFLAAAKPCLVRWEISARSFSARAAYR